MSPETLVAMQWMGIVAIGVLAVWVGGPIVEAIFTKVSGGPPQPSADPSAPDPTTDPESPNVTAAAHVLQGGAWIGLVERVAVFIAVLVGFPDGIALALAIKGIGRYPELKTGNKAAAERFIIGTFVSLLIAAAAGGLARLVLLAM